MTPPVFRLSLRLIVQRDLAVFDRRAQLAQHAEPAHRVVIVDDVVVFEPRAVPLGRIHRHVGVAQQLARVEAMVGRDGDADVDADFDRDAARVDRRSQALDDPLHELLDRGVARHVGENHGKLVAADAADERAARELRREATRHLAQHLVADVMTERVVDFLEAREVEHQQSHPLARVRLTEQSAEIARERSAVRQARQRIVRRLMLQRALLRLSFADVAHDGREQAFFRRDTAQRDLDGQLVTVRRTRRTLERCARQRFEAHVDVALQARHELREVRVEERRLGAAEDAPRRGIGGANRALRIDAHDGVRRRVDDAAQQRVAALQTEGQLQRLPCLLVERAHGSRDERRHECQRKRRDVEHDAARSIEQQRRASECHATGRDEYGVQAPAAPAEQQREEQGPKRKRNGVGARRQPAQRALAHGFRRERLHDDAGQRSMDGNGHDVAKLDCRGPDVDGLAAQRIGIDAAADDVDERNVVEGAFVDREVDRHDRTCGQHRLVREDRLQRLAVDVPRAAHVAHEPVGARLEIHGSELGMRGEARQGPRDRQRAIGAAARLEVAREINRRVLPLGERTLEHRIVVVRGARAEVDVDEQRLRRRRAQHL